MYGPPGDVQPDSVGLRFREVEQAVVATFLRSQPIGQSARSCDLLALLRATRPDRIELEKGLMRWAQTSFWLDDQYTAVDDNQLPITWHRGIGPAAPSACLVAHAELAPSEIQDLAEIIPNLLELKAKSPYL